METSSTITVAARIKAPLAMVWDCWTMPAHIQGWNNASEDWHTPYAQNDLRNGGRFLSRMEARDGSAGFDFGGTYSEVIEHERISYRMDDGRNVTVTFEDQGSTTEVTEVFAPEAEHTIVMQQAGWQAILNNFRDYVETHAKG